MARNGTSKVPYSNTSVAETPNLAKGTHALSVSASGSIGFDGGISPRLLSSVAPHLARRWFLRSRLRASLENAGNPPCKKEPSLNCIEGGLEPRNTSAHTNHRLQPPKGGTESIRYPLLSIYVGLPTSSQEPTSTS